MGHLTVLFAGTNPPCNCCTVSVRKECSTSSRAVESGCDWAMDAAAGWKAGLAEAGSAAGCAVVDEGGELVGGMDWIMSLGICYNSKL